MAEENKKLALLRILHVLEKYSDIFAGQNTR